MTIGMDAQASNKMLVCIIDGLCRSTILQVKDTHRPVLGDAYQKFTTRVNFDLAHSGSKIPVLFLRYPLVSKPP